MKILTTFFAFALAISTFAQSSQERAIQASDPTQVYTFVEGYAGLNFLSNSPTSYGGLDTWEAGFRGTWGIKKFRIGVHLPASNNQTNFRVFDDITLDAGYQIHNNSGIYNATVIGAGFVSPSQDFSLNTIQYYQQQMLVYPYSSNLNKYYFNYLGALKFTEKFSLYPGVEWFQRSKTDQASYQTSDTSYSLTPAIYSFGFKFSLIASYDFNAKNFLQIGAAYSTEDWQGKYGDEPLNAFYSNISEQRLHLYLKYQYAISPFSQVYAKASYYTYSSNLIEASDYYQQPHLYGIQLGFTYFLH